MSSILPLNHGWQFRRVSPAAPVADGWREVELPHIPFVADLDGRRHWFGECEYRRTIELPAGWSDTRCTLHFGAAMHSAVVYIDGREAGRHTGGYLPFEVELPRSAGDARPHTVSIRLDNRENPDVPPGKPYVELDFCCYGGLYRGAELRSYPAVHITDAITAGVPGGGGVFVRTLAASSTAARVSVQTHLRNAGTTGCVVHVDVELLDGTRTVAHARHAGVTVAPGKEAGIELTLAIAEPRLWQPDSPVLHHARVTLRTPEGDQLDSHVVRFGIRRIGFSRSGGFTINGRRLRLRGTNRHQDHPFVGYAVPPAAQRRDARRIKEAGFDYVRLSHYPQAPAFLDACDELGIVVMNCIPGWQFMGGERFREACFQNARDLVRRDRNHPCVVLWELSQNETVMDDAFMARLHTIGHEEYPGNQMFTCGWQDRFDVFTHSRQHGEIHLWRNGDKALVVAEYGDWEFYAANEGFDQKSGAGVFASWSHGRKRRSDGERGLRQQADNHGIALNDTLSSPAVLDGQWSMFDYPRGYDPVRAACGIMDSFRLPKFSWHFYRSQRDPSEGGPGWTGGPVIFIASHWTPASDLRIPVYSNCQEVELRLNGNSLGRLRPAQTAFTQHLPHPPFVFHLPRFSPGALEATGYIDGRPVATHSVCTPSAAMRLTVRIDSLGIAAPIEESDVLFAHAELRDGQGNLCVDETSEVKFHLDGAAEIVGAATVSAEAGIASVTIRVPRLVTSFELRAGAVATKPSLKAGLGWQRAPDGAATRSSSSALVAAP